MGLRRARRHLEAALGKPLTALGVFTVADPEVFQSVVAMATGAAAIGGMSVATGKAVDTMVSLAGAGPRRPTGMPRRVLVVATAEAVTLYAHSRCRVPDTQIGRFGAGQFRAHASRYPFSIDLSISPENGERLVLSGNRGPRHRVAKTVRAVLLLSFGSDLPVPGAPQRRLRIS
ncbi:MAG TPA: hypothetical protein VME46_07365 [Acidimicrobiales bacterium]|nr:hypothetical protein [Acidimicrobiales bacterium]